MTARLVRLLTAAALVWALDLPGLLPVQHLGH